VGIVVRGGKGKIFGPGFSKKNGFTSTQKRPLLTGKKAKPPCAGVEKKNTFDRGTSFLAHRKVIFHLRVLRASFKVSSRGWVAYLKTSG